MSQLGKNIIYQVLTAVSLILLLFHIPLFHILYSKNRQ